MGAYGVSVEKTISFRGNAELTSNVYHYSINAPVASDYDNLAEAVVARDKAAHTTIDATYKTVRVFGPTDGTKADNKMRLVKDLTGKGTRTAGGDYLYPEFAVVSSIYVGRSPVHNRKVFVRKFIHPIKAQTASGIDSMSGQLAATEITFWQNWMNSLKSVTHNAVTFAMCTPKNEPVPQGNAAVTLPYAHIRQLKQ